MTTQGYNQSEYGLDKWVQNERDVEGNQSYWESPI